MNWTEGKLARHSRARQSKQTVLRQKEHFAKARAGLLPNVAQQIPPPVPLFPQGAPPHSRATPTAATRIRGATPADNIERSSTSTGKRRRLPSSPKGQPSNSLQTASRHFAAASNSRPRNSDFVSADGVDDAAIREKRQKLLRDKDWAGTRLQKPIPLHFEQVQPGNKKWTRRQRPLAGRTPQSAGGRHEPRRRLEEKIQQPRRNHDMLITVGSQEVRLGPTGQSEYGSIGPDAVQAHGGTTLPSTIVLSSSSVTDFKEMPKTRHRQLKEPQSSLESVSDPRRSQIAGYEDDGHTRPQVPAPVPLKWHSIPWLPPPTPAAVDYDAGSMLAQVGAQPSSAPSSELRGNEVWRKFVGGTQTDTSLVQPPLHRPERPTQPCISPGVSTRCHQLGLTHTSQNEPTSSYPTDTSGGYRSTHAPPDDSRQPGSHVAQPVPSTNAQSVSYTGVSASPNSQGTASYCSVQSGSGTDPDASVYSPNDDDLGRSSAGHARSGRSNAIGSPVETTHTHPGETDFGYDDDSSGYTDSDTGSVDQRVADYRQAALNLLSRRTDTPLRVEGMESLGTPTQSPQHSDMDNNTSLGLASQTMPQGTREEMTEDTTAETFIEPHTEGATGADTVAEPVAETFAKIAPEVVVEAAVDTPVEASAEMLIEQLPRKKTPEEESDDIWFKYLFSDTNTEELHKQVMEEGAKESARALLQQAGNEDLERISDSDWGHNMSTAATHGNLSIGATQSGDDLTSASAVSASRIAAIGSPVTTQTAGTGLDEWEGSGGPPYAAPSMQGSMSSTTTLPAAVQRDGVDSGSVNQGLSHSIITDTASSFSSKAVEASRSVADQAGMKEPFKFARPKLFVGKRSEPVPEERPVLAVKPVTMSKPRRGRQKRKARDGRANIRSIPVYHDDPIEDFHEVDRSKARGEPSLFGALDME